MHTNEETTNDFEYCQLRRIADALERIAAALEPNSGKEWTTTEEERMNLHSLLYEILRTK